MELRTPALSLVSLVPCHWMAQLPWLYVCSQDSIPMDHCLRYKFLGKRVSLPQLGQIGLCSQGGRGGRAWSAE